MVKKVKFKALLTTAPDQSSWHFLEIGREIVDKFGFERNSRRVLCSINCGGAFPCALMPWGEMFYIMVNKQRRTELGIVAGDTVTVVLEKDESKYGMPMPEELEEVLNQDPDGSNLFHSLTAGKQRSMMYYISKIKDIDKRIHTSLILLEHLKDNDGKIVYEIFRDELKRPIF